MKQTYKNRIESFGIWCSILYLVLLFIGWGFIAGFLPPTPPSLNSTEIFELYQSDFMRIRVGMIFVMVAALVFIPFAAVMSQHIARIEEGAGVLTYTFLLGAAGNMMLTFYPAIWWLVAAFRPDRAAELIYLMNDMAWLQFLGGVTVYLAMPLAVTIASFADDSNTPSFPRWVGYTNFMMALLILPDQLLFFFYDGPFAWNGLFGVWIPVVVFSGFFIVNFISLRNSTHLRKNQI